MSFSYRHQALHIDSVAITDLVANYGSPLYVYARADIENNWRKFDHAFGNHKHLICYAVKANSNLAVLNSLAKIGSGFDVVSIGELQRVLTAGGDANNIVFSGVGKTIAEIRRGLEVGIRCFNVESASELDRIEAVAQSLAVQAPIAIRVNPNIDAKTHPYISTGLRENKFGVEIDTVVDLYQQAHDSKYLDVQGIACHIGSQLVQVSPFLDALDKILVLFEKLNARGIEITHLDLGGGVGIQYDNEQTIDIQGYVESILSKVGQMEIILEPGRAVVANAGVFVTQVEFLKHNNKKSFAIVDAAMNDLMRPALYGAYHQVLPVNKNNNGILATWDIVGPVCETGDFLAKDRKLSLSEGDYLAVIDAGAYCFSMSSNYNSRVRPAEVMVAGDEHRLVRERECLQDLFEKERIVKWKS